MAYKTILTVTGIAGDEGDLRLAAALCREADAHLAVLVLALAAPPPVGEYAAVISDPWLEERKADMADLAERAEAVSRLVATLDVSADVVSRYSETAFSEEAVGVRARYADITILGPDLLSDELLRNRVMEGALFLSGRPVLLMPEGINRATLSPKRVMVAWDSSMEASRAVREALAMLVAAEDVHIVLVDPESGQFEQGDEPGADVAAYLARHGVKLTVDRLPSEGKTIDAVLRSHAMDCGAEMIVMGAYGHSRLRERIFGGVTRSILENVSLPVLMAR